MFFTPNNYVFVINDQGHVLSHPEIRDHEVDKTAGNSMNAKALKAILNLSKTSSNGAFIDYKWNIGGAYDINPTPTLRTAYLYRTKLWHWTIVASINPQPH